MAHSPYTDLARPPLRVEELRRALGGAGSPWRQIEVVARTESTNTDLSAAARAGAGEGRVLVAEEQTAGRGRLGRSWVAPPRSSLTFSVLLRPKVPTSRQGWLPLLAGVAVTTVLRRLAQVHAVLKWPNDVLVNGRKLAGILAERADDALIVGVGINVTTRRDELPIAAATSLAEERAGCTDRDPLLRAILRELGERYQEWAAAGGDANACGLRSAYQAVCDTLGRQVSVELADGTRLTGFASGLDESGHLLVRTTTGEATLSAGDVTHLR